MIETPFIKAYEKSFADSWALAALTNYDTGKTFSYADVARGVARTQLLLQALEVKKGERVALIGEDCAEWCIHWLGIVTYGAVVVPILPAFTADDVEAIINHSDAVVVIVSEETGSISVATGGMLKRHLKPETLENILRNELIPQDEEDKQRFSLLGLLRSKKSGGTDDAE